MKVICDVYKRPKNCPSIGVPKVPDALGGTMSQQAKARDKHMGCPGVDNDGAASDGKYCLRNQTFRMNTTLPWARPLYAKVLDVIRILSHLSVNDVSKRRKVEVKAFLPNQYKKLANPKPAKPEIKLFGDEISEDKRNCVEEAKVTNKL